MAAYLFNASEKCVVKVAKVSCCGVECGNDFGMMASSDTFCIARMVPPSADVDVE